MDRDLSIARTYGYSKTMRLRLLSAPLVWSVIALAPLGVALAVRSWLLVGLFLLLSLLGLVPMVRSTYRLALSVELSAERLKASLPLGRTVIHTWEDLVEAEVRVAHSLGAETYERIWLRSRTGARPLLLTSYIRDWEALRSELSALIAFAPQERSRFGALRRLVE